MRRILEGSPGLKGIPGLPAERSEGSTKASSLPDASAGEPDNDTSMQKTPQRPDTDALDDGTGRNIGTNQPPKNDSSKAVENGCDGGGDSDNMPELLAALSRAVEEEIRSAKGLFGLETGVLERLKGGTRVTPFLTHGSVRRQTSPGGAPHGLAAGGMKKWWRCPRCHISQVRLLFFSIAPVFHLGIQ